MDPWIRTSRRWGTSAASMAVLCCLWLGACTLAPAAETTATQDDPATLQQHQVIADGHPLAIWEKSVASRAGAALLLHGRTWSTVPDFDLQVVGEDLSLMDGLNEAGLDAFGLDARGYGATPRDETGWLTPDRAAKDVIVALEWINEREPSTSQPVLFGWSYGSMVAQLVAQRRPDLVSGLVLFGYPANPDTVLPVGTYPDAAPEAPTTAAAAASDFIVEGSISQHAIDTYVEAALAADPVRVDWRELHQWNELDPSKVTVPTLVIEGEADPITDTRAHTSLFSRLGTEDRTWTVIPGDHAAFLEAPRPIFLDILVGFVMRMSTGSE